MCKRLTKLRGYVRYAYTYTYTVLLLYIPIIYLLYLLA
jgi:hypothetical protein